MGASFSACGLLCKPQELWAHLVGDVKPMTEMSILSSSMTVFTVKMEAVALLVLSDFQILMCLLGSTHLRVRASFNDVHFSSWCSILEAAFYSRV